MADWDCLNWGQRVVIVCAKLAEFMPVSSVFILSAPQRDRHAVLQME